MTTKTVKIIKVESCQTCPYEGKCKAWTSISNIQRLISIFCTKKDSEFILAKCHLDDEDKD